MYNFKSVERSLKRDPLFLKRVFVSHYCNVPYHVMMNERLYPITLIEELYEGAFHTIRHFELAPYNVDELEDVILKKIKDGSV